LLGKPIEIKEGHLPRSELRVAGSLPLAAQGGKATVFGRIESIAVVHLKRGDDPGSWRAFTPGRQMCSRC
jgi:hypothetical protein